MPTSSSSSSKTSEPKGPTADDIAEAFENHTGATLYLDAPLDDATRAALLKDHQLTSELDGVRGVDAVREASDEEIASVLTQKASTSSTSTSSSAA